MQPFVVRQGDFLLSLAHKFGFDPDAVWNDASNDSLRKIRPNPDILLPGDVLYIPDQVDKKPDFKSLVVGSMNAFTSDIPTTTLRCKLVGPETATYASKAFTVQELPELVGQQTDAQGVATFPILVTLRTATITITETGECIELAVAALDPIDSIAGIFKRLQNLGHIPREVDGKPVERGDDLEMVRSGLRYFKASQSGDDGAAAGSTPAASPSDPTDGGSPPSSRPSDSSWASAPGSNDGAPPDGDPAPASVPPGSGDDDAGLANDATLDADLAALLLKVHGC